MLHLLLLRDPRALVLASRDFALVFRIPDVPAPLSDSASVVVEFVPIGDIDLRDALSLYDGRVSGCLGIIKVAGETFLPMITTSTVLGSHGRSFHGVGTEPISRILSVEFVCLTSSAFDSLTSIPLDGQDSFDDAASSSSTTYNRNGASEILEHPCAGIRKILCNGSFYYSASGEGAFDLSTRLEKRLERETTASAGASVNEDNEGLEEDEFDPRFLWNTFLISPLLKFRASLASAARSVFDRQDFVVLAIQGYCGVYDIILGGEPAVLSLVSRLGWKRAGTRFNVRGADDDGSTANFVETETILRTASMCFSYVQVRGSVPGRLFCTHRKDDAGKLTNQLAVFWEEVGLQPFGLKINITRPIESSLPAFVRHFDELIEEYSSVHIINLLSIKDQEAILSNAYENHLSSASNVDENIREKVAMTPFDFHARSRIGGIESVKSQLAVAVGGVEEQFGACLISVDREGKASLLVGQRGVFRTNCKDCLDRTNVVEDVLSRFALEDFIKNSNPNWLNNDSNLWNSHRTLFAENGDCLSRIYVGTGALNTSFTRSGKKSFAGLLSDATKSVGRMYQSNFMDEGKQKAIDALLGFDSRSQKIRVYNPVDDLLRATLKSRAAEYTNHEAATLFVGTYNLNGKGPGSESILPWLFPTADEPAILALAFQEIVQLTPQMIMLTDPEKKRRWEAHILQTISGRPEKKSDYILLRSGQLVGTALIILIKAEIAGDVRNVEISTKKTGLKGMAGNKGAVAIRFDYRDTSFCFLTAHLAAGHSNYLERDQDYFTIAEGLHFQKGRSLASHDNVIWASDTNYRISLPNEEVRSLAVADDYATLYASDQLAQSMRSRRVFAGFSEGPLLFRPTYKYDNGTQTYDSSEKQRIPAWTDRILYSGVDLDLSRYQRVELMASDHRPVYAILRAQIKTIDRAKRNTLRKAIMSGLLAGGSINDLSARLSRTIVAASEELSLPLPSDDNQTWWDDAYSIPTQDLRRRDQINPFDDDDLVVLPIQSKPRPSPPRIPSRNPKISSSVITPSRPTPPLPLRKPSTSSISSQSSLQQRPPSIPRRPTAESAMSKGSTSGVTEVSLLDGEDDSLKGSKWEVISA